jgi:hypothetical protein
MEGVLFATRTMAATYNAADDREEVGMTRRDARTDRPGPPVAAVLAVLFGALGWAGAHVLTRRLLGHRHEPRHGLDAGVMHVHATDSALAVLGMTWTATALLAVLLGVAVWRRRRADDLAATVRRAGTWSTVAFLIAETGAYAMSPTHVVPPPLVLLLGATVHALATVCTALLWQRSIRGVLLVAVFMSVAAARRKASFAAMTAVRPWSRSVWAVLRSAGRAPPVREPVIA